MSRRKLIFVATSAVVAMCLTTANSAFADNGSSSDEAVSSVTKADPSLAEDAVKVSEENITGQSPLNVGDSQITLPKDAAKTIEVDSKDRSDISVSLPFAETAASAQVVADRVVYDNQNGSKTVPVPRGDGSMQINTVIESPSAPTAYPYTFSVPGTAEVREEGGTVLFLDQDGKMLGGLAPAWAKDANGNSVPTHYEVSGTAVTQVVEHGEGSAYPIVADPWLGDMLFMGFTDSRKPYYNGQPVYSAMLTPWGWRVYTGTTWLVPTIPSLPLIGNAIIRTFGWNEWKTFLVGPDPADTLKQQYDCHVLVGYAVWKAGFHWDLEAGRPSRPNWQYDGLFDHQCNWDH